MTHAGANQLSSNARRRKFAPSSSLTGTGKLLLFMLRRDRFWLPAWTGGLTLLLIYVVYSLDAMLDPGAMQNFVALAQNPVMVLIGGPNYGFDSITLERFVVSLYGVYLLLGAALMSILTVCRHTTTEEETGRGELVRASVVGRNAPLAAALILSVIMNVLLAALLAATMSLMAATPHLGAAVLFGCSVAAAGLVFAAFTALTVQLTASSRSAAGLAGMILAAAFVLRGLGDMSANSGGRFAWLVWLSPLGWSQQTAPYTLDRWWPLGISMLVSLALVNAAVQLQSVRDFGAGVLPSRSRVSRIAIPIKGPISLSVRLQAPTILWWSASFLLAGLVFGLFAEPMMANFHTMPTEVLAMLGDSGKILEGYLGFIGVYFAIMAAAFAITAVSGLKNEEISGRTDSLLSTPLSRYRWYFSWLVVSAIGVLALLFAAGLGVGAGAALSTETGSLFWAAVWGHVAQAPAALVVLALAAALYGIGISWVRLGWVFFAYFSAITLFGGMLQLSEAIMRTSIFEHIGAYPARNISWTSSVTILVAATALAAGGAILFRRRDLRAD